MQFERPCRTEVNGPIHARAASRLGVLAVAIVGLLAPVFAIAMTAVAPSVASAGDSCVVGSDYPPSGPDGSDGADLVLVDLSLPPGGTGSVELSGAVAGATYDGFIYSDPIALPATTAGADGSLMFSGLAVPADFDVTETHTIDLCNGGALVLSSSFCLDGSGNLASFGACAPAGGGGDGGNDDGDALAFTGIAGIGWMIRVAVVLIALGFALRHWRRRRELTLA